MRVLFERGEGIGHFRAGDVLRRGLLVVNSLNGQTTGSHALICVRGFVSILLKSCKRVRRGDLLGLLYIVGSLFLFVAAFARHIFRAKVFLGSQSRVVRLGFHVMINVKRL